MIIGRYNTMDDITVTNYGYKRWNDIEFKIREYLPKVWKEFIGCEEEELDNIEKFLNEEGKTKMIFPYPELVFSIFRSIYPYNIKVVFIGQDPYFGRVNGIPQAMGCSFSIPVGMRPFPPSLDNIYKNLEKYEHLIFKPINGNLQFWVRQGCLMINTAFTVQEKNPRSHTKIWEKFTNCLISSISEKCESVIFVIWGNDAYQKLDLINLDKHDVIISSHPSPLSYDKSFKNYPSFSNTNHFKKINDILNSKNKSSIIWQIS